MRLIRFVFPVIAILALCAGCGNSGPQGRIVVCDHTGAVLGDILFSSKTPPSKDELFRKLASLVPTLPKNGNGIEVAAATMGEPSYDFKHARTLSDFEKSLQGGAMILPCFEAVDDGHELIVWRHDPEKWTEKTANWQMKGQDHSDDLWRDVIASNLADNLKTLLP